MAAFLRKILNREIEGKRRGTGETGIRERKRRKDREDETEREGVRDML